MMAFAFYVGYAVFVVVAIVSMSRLFLHFIGPPQANEVARMYVLFALLLLVMASVVAYELWSALDGSIRMVLCKGRHCGDITYTLHEAPGAFVFQVVAATVLMAAPLAMAVACAVQIRRIRTRPR